MALNRRPTTVLETLGEEIVRILTPVSICMFMVVVLVSVLGSGSSPTSSSIATIAYSETSSDSTWDKIEGALLNSLVFVGVITVATFGLFLLFYLRCTGFLKYYMAFSAFTVLGFLGGEIALFLVEDFAIPVDSVTFSVILFNFSVVGVLAVFMSKMAIFVTQAYLVAIGMFVAYYFTLLPEWTTWVLLIAMALYDMAAVLLPVGPLRLLVELAISRDEEIPALVYEARPVSVSDSNNGAVRRRLWRDRRSENPELVSDAFDESGSGLVQSEGRVEERSEELVAPLLDREMSLRSVHIEEGQNPASSEDMFLEGMGLGSSGAIKLGLGDFIFYSVLVGRAAMYDYMTVYACYLAIVAGLGITLMLLAFYQKALPALPVSIILGVLFYVLTRFLLEIFVLQCSFNLLMF